MNDLLQLVPGSRCIVRRNVAPMLAEPRQDAEMVSQVLYWEYLDVQETRRSFVHVQGADGYAGWVPRGAVVPDPGRAPWKTRKYLAGELLVPVYALPGYGQETLLTRGTLVRVRPKHRRLDKYVRCVVHPDGRLALVLSAQVTRYQEPLFAGDPEDVCNLARTFVGVPYLWGGRTPFGMDCSGFTQRVYALAGVVIPRDAHLQASWSGFDHVRRNELEPGDLMFFAGKDDPRGRDITHVALCLGMPWFVHSAEGIGVTLASWKEERWARERFSHGGRFTET